MDAVRFETFLKKCEKAGLKAKECSPYHWQVFGGKFLVNYFNGRRGRTVYVGQTTHGIPGSDEIAIRCAKELPKVECDDRKPFGYKKFKKRMFKKSNICYLCLRSMTFEEASVDHVIPLSKGGLNHHNNYRLAHERCNQQKGNNDHPTIEH